MVKIFINLVCVSFTFKYSKSLISSVAAPNRV